MPDHTGHDPEEMAEALSPLHARLLADGADWRTHAPDTTSLSRFLDTLHPQRNVDMHDLLPEQRLSTLVSPARIAATRRWSFAVIAAVVLIAILGGIVFTRSHQPSAAPRTIQGIPTQTPSPTPIPPATFSPGTVTAHGLTVQIDNVDANAFRIAVSYHVVNPLPHPSDEYAADDRIVDEQGNIHPTVGGKLQFDAHSVRYYVTDYFTPLSLASSQWHTLRFLIPSILFIPGEGGALAYRKSSAPVPWDSAPVYSQPGSPTTTIPGPWNFTLHVFPTVSGGKALSLPAQTRGGITIVPMAIQWVTGTAEMDEGVEIRLAINGISNVADTHHHYFYPSMSVSYGNSTGSSGSGYSKNAGTLTFPDGTVATPFAYFVVANDQYTNPQARTGGFKPDGSALIDAGFQSVTLRHGQTLQLSISAIGLFDPSVAPNMSSSSFPGPWTFTFTV